MCLFSAIFRQTWIETLACIFSDDDLKTRKIYLLVNPLFLFCVCQDGDDDDDDDDVEDGDDDDDDDVENIV